MGGRALGTMTSLRQSDDLERSEWWEKLERTLCGERNKDTRAGTKEKSGAGWNEGRETGIEALGTAEGVVVKIRPACGVVVQERTCGQ